MQQVDYFSLENFYYFKFHFKLNHIEQFWYNRKQKIGNICYYTLKD